MKDKISSRKTYTGDRIEAKKIVAGAIVHADVVKVYEVSSGAVVIADEIRDLEIVKAGGVVVTPRIKSNDFEIKHTGYHFASLEEYIQHLHEKLSNLDAKAPQYAQERDNLELKLEAVKQFR